MKLTKSLTYRISLFGMLFLVLASCQPKKEAPANGKTEPAEEVDPPKDIISLDEAKQLCENYERRRIPGIIEFEKAASGSEDEFVPTQFVTFNLETLKTYIQYVEQEAKKVNVAPDSLRIYLANYGKEGRDPNRNTVFILPTAKVEGDYGGFYIDGEEAKLIRNYWPKDENGGQEEEPRSKAAFLPNFNTSLLQGGGSLILNYGGSGPPPKTDF